MRLLVTGAGGFLGRYVVASAIRRDHCVRAMVRPATQNVPASWRDHPQVEIARADLRARGSFDALLEDVEAIVHLAATKSGDLYEQFAGTVLATENLLQAMRSTGVNRLVMTSSFAVYEYLLRWSWSLLDESSLLACDPFDRDEYCLTKLEQERLVREYVDANSWRCVILRPGVVFGRGNLWTARLGVQLNDHWWVRTGNFSPLPLTYVENCSDAIVQATEYDGQSNPLVLNIVDDETPTQWRYMNELRTHFSPRPRVIPIPWNAMRLVARSAWLVNRICFTGTAKIPGLFVPSRLHARCKPLRYSNRRARAALGWSPRYSWREGIRRSLSADDPTELPAAYRHVNSESIRQVQLAS